MVTPFSPKPIQVRGGTESLKDEVYTLSGLNMVTPDELIDTATRRFNRQYLGQSPYTINSRMLARDADQQRFAIGTRKGNSNMFGLENTTDSPLVLENMLDLDAFDSGWVDWYGLGTTAHDATVKYTGTNSIKIITDAASGLCGMEKNISADLTGKKFKVYLRSTDWTKVSTIKLLISTSGTFVSYYVVSLKPLLPVTTANKWIEVNFSTSDFTVGAGTPNLTTVNKIVAQVVGTPGNAATAWFDELIQYNASGGNEVMFSATKQIAFPITVPVNSLSYGFNCLSQLCLNIRKTAGQIEAINIQICRDNAGVPGTVIAQSSYDTNSVGTAIATVKAKFIDAPALNTAGENLWGVMWLTNAPTAQVFVQSGSASTGLTMDISQASQPWVAAGANSNVLFISQCFRSGMALGAHRRVVAGETPTTILATGYGDLIWFDNNQVNGLVYSYAPGYNVTNHKFRFNQQDNWTIFVNGVIQPSYWDNTGVTALSNAPAAATHVTAWKNRVFMVAGNKISFTDLLTTLANANSWPAVNYFYPNTPNDPDYVTAIIVFQDNLIVFTKETKYIVRMTGAGISSITISQVKGSKGAISQECVATDGNFVYFIASDYRMYRFNGVSDGLISDNVEPEIRAAQTPELLSSIQIHNNIVRYHYARTPSAQVDRTLIYDVTHAEWFLDTGRPIAFSIQHNLEDHRIVEFSANTTMAMLGDSTYSDMGKPIDFKYWTNYKAYGSGAAKKRVRRFRPIIKASGNPFYIKVGKDIDFANTPDMRNYLVSAKGNVFGDGHVFGDGSVFGGTSMVNDPAGMSGRGKHLQYRFEKNGVNTLTMIYGYIGLYKKGRNK